MAPILSYCMNVHPGETLEELLANLEGPVAQVRSGWRGERAMGAGLWLPLEIARAIAEQEEAAERVRSALKDANLFAYTANAFPIGGFHEQRVKREVYKPTWMDTARLDYTLLACRALAKLLPDGQRGSVSTVPLTFKAFDDTAYQDRAGRHLARLTLELRKLEDHTGREVAVALEPEPLALLEDTEETVAFLKKKVFAGPGRMVLEDEGLTPDEAEQLLRRFVGVCVDTCHLACEFEHIPASLETLRGAGVRVVKAQLSSAPELQDPTSNDEGRARLKAFDEGCYLHQSIAIDGTTLPQKNLIRAEDLGEVFETERPRTRGTTPLSPPFRNAAVIRTHFHVPLTWEGDRDLGSTRIDLEEALADLAQATDHLEVETYTFDVLPEDQRSPFEGDVIKMITAELEWAEQALQAEGVTVR